MRTEIKYALLLILLESLRLLAGEVVGEQGYPTSQQKIGMTIFIAPFIWLIYRAVRTNMTEEPLTAKPLLVGAKTGFFTLLIAGAGMASIHYLFFRYIHPEYFDNLIRMGIERGGSEEKLKGIYTLSNHLRLFIFFPSYGLVLGGISGYLLRKKHPGHK